MYGTLALLPYSIKQNIARKWNTYKRLSLEKYDGIDIPPVLKNRDVCVLDLSFTSGYGQTVHPDVIYSLQGIIEPNVYYLMTLTGFPDSNDYFENPEFLVSKDGINWRLPQGGASPLIAPPSNWIGYHSDPCLLYDYERKELFLFYRTVREERDATVLLSYIKTHDGIAWDSPVFFLEKKRQKNNASVLMSPTIHKIEGKYVMWFVDEDATGVLAIMRADSTDLKDWHPPIPIDLKLDDGEDPWHIHVCVRVSKQGLVMSICCHNRSNPSSKKLRFATSDENGIEWTLCEEQIKPGDDGFGEVSLYRAAMVDFGGKQRLYYSGKGNDQRWFTVMKEIKI